MDRASSGIALALLAAYTFGIGCAAETSAVSGPSGGGGNTSAGESAGGSGADTSGGTSSSGSGGSGGTAGAPLGGTSGESSGGQSNGGESALAGEGGAAGGAEGGSAGAGPCESTAPDEACTCQHHDDHDYWLCNEDINFGEASGKCNAVGMKLVELSGMVEDAWVYDSAILAIGQYWIGGSDQVTDGTWLWTTGAQFWSGTEGGPPSGYANWRDDEPNGNGGLGDCAMMQTGFDWDDRSCGDALSYVCEQAGGSLDPEPFDCGTTVIPNCTCTNDAGHDYVYCNHYKVWQTANVRCESLGMHLVRPNDTTENDWLYSTLAGNNTVWTAGNDVTLEGTFRWADSSNDAYWLGGSAGAAQMGAWTDWNTNEPNASGDCMILQAGPSWDDLSCTNGVRHICESD
jgi:hypothetical protein